MNKLVWLLVSGIFVAAACKRADPKETQMAGEPPKALAEPPIAAPPEEKIPAPGEPAAAPVEAAPSAPGVKDPSYDLTLQQPAEGPAGGVVVASVKVTPGKGYKVNEEYPTKLSLESAEGITAAKSTLAKADAAAFDKHQLVFDVKLTPARAGEFTVRGKLTFAVCTDATCDPKTERIAFNVRAK